MLSQDLQGLFEQAKNGSRAALARLITQVESSQDHELEIAAIAYSQSAPYVVGLTGAPGAGKSTTTDQLINVAMSEGSFGGKYSFGRIAILCVDPTSPFSGGALLGDRFRMQGHVADERVYIRSMATRGHLGGLALAVPDTIRMLGAVGFEFVIVETVGVGQMEVEIASTADTTVVLVNPGWGDEIQADKAGLLEVADVFDINKSDRAGTAATRRDLERMIDMAKRTLWRPPIVETEANTGRGIGELWAAIVDHRSFLSEQNDDDRRRLRASHDLNRVLRSLTSKSVYSDTFANRYEKQVDAMVAGTTDPYRAARVLLFGQ